jgi:cyclopropane-fatty-acyl-phospholipid synthase
MSIRPQRLRPVAIDDLLDRSAERLLAELGRRLKVGRLTVQLPDGTKRTFDGVITGPTAEIRIHDARVLWRILLGGEPAGGESYMDGQWSSPDLVAAISLAALNREALKLTGGWQRAPLQLPRTIAHRARRNTVAGTRRNITAHYDLGNEFYRLFLDETMTYSSAVFTAPDQSLADAQRNKYRLLAERAGLREGMHVLEIGSGWGGFALYAGAEIGCRVTTVTVSRAQHELAIRRVREAGLDNRVSVELRDYRQVDGQYDAIVSIEMLEAVGAEYYTTFFEKCDQVLRPGGRMSLQSICFPDVAYEPQRRTANWIQQYIFPGGLLPSLAEIERSLHGTRLLITGTQDIAQHYVRTLATWRASFMSRLPEVRRMGFDERFIRMWEYYLALSEAGFATGLVQNQQIVFEKRRGISAPAPQLN